MRAALALAPGCALLIAAALVGAGEGPSPARAAIGSLPRAAAVSHFAPPANRSRQAFALARDPFVPPPGVPGEESAAPATAPARAPAPLAAHGQVNDELPALRAVIAGERRMALLETNRRTHLVREGDRLATWRVLSIDAGGIVLARGALRLRLPIEAGS